MVSTEEHERIVTEICLERDAWEAIARERQAAIEKLWKAIELSQDRLKADRSAAVTRRPARQRAQFAGDLMLLLVGMALVLFVGIFVVAGIVRETRECPAATLERPQ